MSFNDKATEFMPKRRLRGDFCAQFGVGKGQIKARGSQDSKEMDRQELKDFSFKIKGSTTDWRSL